MILCEFHRREDFVLDGSFTVLSFSQLCSNRKLNCSETPICWLNVRFCLLVRVCILLKVQHAFLLTSVCSILHCWTLFFLCFHRKNNKFYCTDKSFQCNGTLPKTIQVLVWFVVFDGSLTTASKEEITGWISREFVSAFFFK